VLCNSNDIKIFGYDKILEPLIKKTNRYLKTKRSVHPEIGASIKGTVLFVSADHFHLQAFRNHSLLTNCMQERLPNQCPHSWVFIVVHHLFMIRVGFEL